MIGIAVWFIGFRVNGVEEGVNLISNGDFEKSPLGEGVPEGWKAGKFPPRSIFIVEETHPDSTGKKCVKFENVEEKAKSQAIHSELIPINPKIPLHISLWYKTEGMLEGKRAVYLGVAWYDQGQSLIGLGPDQGVKDIYLSNDHPEDWTELKRVMNPKDENYIAKKMGWFFIPQEAAFVEIRLMTINYPGRLWVDDIVVVQKPL